MRNVTFAVTQFAASQDKGKNIDTAEKLVRESAAAGAQVILLQELFEGLYWCQQQDQAYFAWSAPVKDHPVIQRFASLAAELQVVLPVPFFERCNNAHFNSVAVLDADGSMLGVYRKTHIPDGPGYQEKFYFNPGDTGLKVFDTRYGKLGLAICWDQWFPEVARALALQGAEAILYPTAIGSEPTNPTYSSYLHWARVQLGHAGANLLPVVVSNRIGTETFGSSSITFYGGSFIGGPSGEVVAQVGADSIQHGSPHRSPETVEGFACATFDLDAVRSQRLGWGVFRDRRPELYQVLNTLGGTEGNRSTFKC